MPDTNRLLRQGQRSGWSEAERELLSRELTKAQSEGRSLKQVFDLVAMRTGRKPNSIRNFYYSTMRGNMPGGETPPARMPFNTFTEDEVRRLLKEVISAQARGISVRHCTLSMGGGDKTAMLRYQNKYRSLLKSHPALVKDIMDELRGEGKPVIDPYMKSMGQSGKPVDINAMAAEFAGDLCSLGEAGEALVAGLRSITSMALRHQYGRRKAAEYDAIAAKHDYIATRLSAINEAAEEFLSACGEGGAADFARRVIELSNPF